MDILVRRIAKRRCRSEGYCAERDFRELNNFWRGLGHECPRYRNRRFRTQCTRWRSKHAFADRAEFLADTDFVEAPVAKLLCPEYAVQIAANTDRQKRYQRQELPVWSSSTGRIEKPE